MEETLAALRGFAAGEIEPTDFRDRLYADVQFEKYLSDDPKLLPGNYVGQSVYRFLLEQDFEDPGGVLNAQGAVVDFLARNGIDHVHSTKFADFYNILLDAHPRWLNLDTRYIRDHVLPSSGQRAGRELLLWLRNELRKRFRYVKRPPRWIQSPAWPVGPSGPLVFLGQVDVEGYFHDAATVYVFHDPVSGTLESVVQIF